MTKIAPFFHKFSVSWPFTDFKAFTLAHFTDISPGNHIWHDRLDANIGGEYLKKASPNPTKLA